MNNVEVTEPKLNNKTLAFLLRDKLHLNIYDLCLHIKDNYKSIDVITIKKNYAHIITDLDINKVVLSYIKQVIDKLELDIDDTEYNDIVSNNIDVFFEINYTDKTNTYTIEIASYN